METIIPAADDIGQRLDRYLRKVFPGAKLGEIYEALRTKKITISGKKLPESTRLREGDVLEINVSEDILKLWKGGSYGWGENEKRSVKSEKLDPTKILYEDSDLLIYEKPAGLIVHSPDHKTDEVSLIDQIEDYLQEKGWKPSGTFAHPALAHRIDRDTSGIIISCLTRKSFESMADQFRTRKVKKTYHALVSGIPEPKTGIVKAPLLRLDTGRTDEAKMIVDPKGDPAETEYNTLQTYPEQNYSLIELHPKTGRTHQIRIHMAHIGHPLIGDKRYGGPSLTRFSELMKTELSARHGHLLHASGIEFIHPSAGEKMIIESRSPFTV